MSDLTAERTQELITALGAPIVLHFEFPFLQTDPTQVSDSVWQNLCGKITANRIDNAESKPIHVFLGGFLTEQAILDDEKFGQLYLLAEQEIDRFACKHNLTYLLIGQPNYDKSKRLAALDAMVIQMLKSVDC
jgi:hypothetical protein